MGGKGKVGEGKWEEDTLIEQSVNFLVVVLVPLQVIYLFIKSCKQAGSKQVASCKQQRCND